MFELMQQQILCKIIGHRVQSFTRNRQYKVLRDLLCYGAKQELINLCRFLLDDGYREFIEFEPRPQCLLNALKTRNEKIIKVILNGLINIKHFYFVCDDVFKECIKIDDIHRARILIEHFRYIPKQKDYHLANKYNQAMHIWLQQRAQSYRIERVEDKINLSDWDNSNDDDL